MADARERAEQKATQVVAESFGLRNAISTRIGAKVAAALLDGPDPLAVLTADLQPLLDLHRPFGIYEDCGHRHSEGDEGVTCIDDIGLTCAAKLYDICAECCRDGDYQSEACADHQHALCWPCPTVVALPAGLREATGG
jgi:hypothetical protein